MQPLCCTRVSPSINSRSSVSTGILPGTAMPVERIRTYIATGTVSVARGGSTSRSPVPTAHTTNVTPIALNIPFRRDSIHARTGAGATSGVCVAVDGGGRSRIMGGTILGNRSDHFSFVPSEMRHGCCCWCSSLCTTAQSFARQPARLRAMVAAGYPCWRGMDDGFYVHCTAVCLWISDCADMALPPPAGRLIGRPVCSTIHSGKQW
jgi:hypothetical protein